MICGGDELSRSQRGNNNAYCQDNELSWYAWELDDDQRSFLHFVQELVRFRTSQPVLQRRKFFSGEINLENCLRDLSWLGVDGCDLTPEDWRVSGAKCLAVLLSGDAAPKTERDGSVIKGDTILILINGATSEQNFTLPPYLNASHWNLRVDTRFSNVVGNSEELYPVGSSYTLTERSMAVFTFRYQE